MRCSVTDICQNLRTADRRKYVYVKVVYRVCRELMNSYKWKYTNVQGAWQLVSPSAWQYISHQTVCLQPKRSTESVQQIFWHNSRVLWMDVQATVLATDAIIWHKTYRCALWKYTPHIICCVVVLTHSAVTSTVQVGRISGQRLLKETLKTVGLIHDKCMATVLLFHLKHVLFCWIVPFG